MNEQVMAIAARLRGLRESAAMDYAEMAEQMNVSEEQYAAYEEGGSDIPIGCLIELAKNFRMDVTVLLTGEEPKLHAYCLTRAGEGVCVERNEKYVYQSLAYNFIDKRSDPLYVVVAPEPDDKPVPLNRHPGQEFDYILEGNMQLVIGGKEMILKEGDSIYFDSSVPHGMKSNNDQPVKFIAIVYPEV